jgi:UDP-N-acetylmuramyl pentapeptide phosphotransferase/UDP-N-acetylglucosamine-1-phosphate transferase
MWGPILCPKIAPTLLYGEKQMSMQVWSFVLTLVGFIATGLQIRKNKHGWSIALLCQMMWAAYAITTWQMGFMLGVAVNASFSVYGFINWNRKPATELQPA